MSGVMTKADIPRPVLQRETVQVEALDGEVIIQQMTLQLYLETIRYGMANENTAPIAKVLAACVLDADDQPVFDEAEWEAWAPGHLIATFDLYAKVKTLSGIDLEKAAKN